MKKILLLALVALTIQAQAQDTTVVAIDSTHNYYIVHYNTEPITINIPPLMVGNSVVMRKAKVHGLSFDQKYKTVSVSCEILSYAFLGSNFTDTTYIDNSNYGQQIGSMPTRGLEIIATNATLVNPATGAIILDPQSGGIYCGQYDFFFYVASYMPVKVNELITQYLTANKNWEK